MKESKTFWPLFILLVLGFLVVAGAREISASHRPWCQDKHSCILLRGGAGRQTPQPPLPGRPGQGQKGHQNTWGGFIQQLKQQLLGGGPCD